MQRLACLALFAAVIVGCKGSKSEGPSDKAPPAAGSAGSAAGSAAQASAGSGDLTPSCQKYKEEIAKLQDCANTPHKLPPGAFENLKRAYDQAWSMMPTLSTDQRESSCKAMIVGVDQQGKTFCGW
jgi:hypothetical protein